MAVVAVAVLSATIAAIITTSLVAHRPIAPELIAQPIHVFDVDGDCATQTQRVYVCSMGLAKSPNAYRTPNDVVTHRVWHGDVLMTDCIVTNGIRITDEKGTGSYDWYRIRLPDVPGGVAWLPAVRTRDHPVLPLCPTD